MVSGRFFLILEDVYNLFIYRGLKEGINRGNELAPCLFLRSVQNVSCFLYISVLSLSQSFYISPA